MKKQMITILLIVVGMMFASGCSTSVSRVKFQGQTICSGQSSDSVEERLGQPDRVAQCRYDWFWGMIWEPSSQALRINPWSTQPPLILQQNLVEWIYIDSHKSLILWLHSGTVGQMWIVRTVEIR